jgi:hypothetical protein
MIPETLKFIASEETGLGIFLVTERVIPLSSILETLSAEEKVIGVFQIIVLPSFLSLLSCYVATRVRTPIFIADIFELN